MLYCPKVYSHRVLPAETLYP